VVVAWVVWSVGFCGVSRYCLGRLKRRWGRAGWRVELVDWDDGLECVWVVGGLHR